MILVDTAVWIDHLHASEPLLITLLEEDGIGSHALVIEELALGSIKNRDAVLSLLSDLHRFPVPSHREVMLLTDRQQLWGRGLSAVDVHLLAAVKLVDGASLWTRDKRLQKAARSVDVSLVEA